MSRKKCLEDLDQADDNGYFWREVWNFGRGGACEALLIESERYQENVHSDNITSTEAHSKTFLLRIFRNNKQQKDYKSLCNNT